MPQKYAHAGLTLNVSTAINHGWTRVGIFPHGATSAGPAPTMA
jgi:hypothetical protein